MRTSRLLATLTAVLAGGLIALGCGGNTIADEDEEKFIAGCESQMAKAVPQATEEESASICDDAFAALKSCVEESDASEETVVDECTPAGSKAVAEGILELQGGA